MNDPTDPPSSPSETSGATVIPLKPRPRGDFYEVVRETWLTQKPRVTSQLVAASATAAVALGSLIFLLDVFHGSEWMQASYDLVFNKHQYWRLWTTTFAHADFGHFASNSLLFFILGYFLYGYFGWKLFPLAALVWGGLINAVVLPTYEPEQTLVGASGIVYWMGGVWLVLYFFLSRQKNLTQRWLRTLGVGILIFMPAETFEPHVSYRTHFVGFVLGLAVGVWHFWRNRDRYLAAEVRERIYDEADPGDDLPPPDGFPTYD